MIGCSRMNCNVWWHLTRRGYRKELLTRRFWRQSYIWHDSFGKYINRYVTCRLFGHRNVQVIDMSNGNKRRHCFACECDTMEVANEL
jgi:hypothetical protein